VKDPKVFLRLCDAKDLDETGSYDVIAMFDVIEHIPVFEMEIIWRKVRKILRPKGMVVFSTPLKFDNPNAPDHSDRIYAEMGMHCHKQTHGTIARTSVEHEFVIGQNNDRCFGLVRRADLPSFPEERRTRFLENQKRILISCGLAPEKGVADDHEVHSLVPGAGRILVGCITENNPKYLAQALSLVQSLRWFGGSMAGANIMVCIVDDANPEYVAEFKKWGAFVRVVPRFSYFHPQFNKLRLFDLPDVYAYDTIMLMDCDTIIVQDPSPFITGDTFQARIADRPTVTRDVFERLFARYGLTLPEETYKCTVTSHHTILGCSAGVLIFPQSIMRSFVPLWRKYAMDLSMNQHLLNEGSHFSEQAALTFAFSESPVPFRELPIEMNFPLHLSGPDALERIKICDPVVIHYHHVDDASGLISGGLSSPASRRIDQFNERLKQIRVGNDFQIQTKSIDSILESKNSQIRVLEACLTSKDATLDYIYHSYGLGALWVCNKLVDKLFPPNSRRRSLARMALKSIRRPDSRNTGPGVTPASSA
jgi:hypothetical protein